MRNEINSLISTFDLHDVWRVKNRETKRFTWRQKKPLIECRLDFWLISDQLHDFVKNTQIFCAPNTDHSAIDLAFESIDAEFRGRAYWKFNSSLINDQTYAKRLEDNYKLWLTEYESEVKDKRLLWDLVKYRIRLFTISYCKRKSKERRDVELKLKTEIEKLDQELSETNSDETLAKYNKCKTDLEILYDNKLQGSVIRSKAMWHEHGEKSTKYFYSLEKRNYTKNICVNCVLMTTILQQIQR